MSCDDWAEKLVLRITLMIESLNRARLLLEVDIEIEEDDEVT